MATLFLIPLIVLALAFGFTPYYSRRNTAFGVLVPEDCYRDMALRRFRRGYLYSNLAAGALAALVCLLPWPPVALPWAFGCAMGFQLLVGYFAFLYYHRRCRLRKESEGWAARATSAVVVDITPESRLLPSGWWLLSFGAIIGLTLLLTVLLYPNAPQQIPQHSDLYGRVDAYLPKSPGAFAPMPIIQLFMAALFAFIYWVVRTAKRQLDPEHPQESRQSQLRFRRAWLVFTLVCGNLTLLLFSLFQLASLGVLSMGLSSALSLGIALAILVYACLLGALLGQGGSRLRAGTPGKYISARDDDRYWKMGWLYYNPEDPALFVEKRFGVGWTSNFARPMTYLFLFGLLALVVLLPLILWLFVG